MNVSSVCNEQINHQVGITTGLVNSTNRVNDTICSVGGVDWSVTSASVWNSVTLPIRFLVAVLYLTPFSILFYPIEFICNKIVDLYDMVRFSRGGPDQLDFSQEQLQKMQKTYWALGSDKWKEGVEMFFHPHGPYVFDQGSHGGSIEPGFKRGWDRGAHFLSYQFSRRVDADLYLKLHDIVCSHFMGSINGTLMGRDKVGVFRGLDDAVSWTIPVSAEQPQNVAYPICPEAEHELLSMNETIRQKFGVKLAKFEINTDGSKTMKYEIMPREKVKAIYNFFSENLYCDLANAQTEREKLIAISNFFKRSEWLHAVRDGSGRCDLLIFNFLLTQNGFHPIILNAPYWVSIADMPSWINYLEQGLQNWRNLLTGVLKR